jgi:four helix bundle protein
MGEIKQFENLQVWRLSRELAALIWKLIQKEGFKSNFALRDQIDRSSGSIMDNISEGFGRNGLKEFIQFLSVAKGSCFEVKSQLYRAIDRKLISTEEFEEAMQLSDRVGKMISGLMRYLKTTPLTGGKFKEPRVSYHTDISDGLPDLPRKTTN